MRNCQAYNENNYIVHYTITTIVNLYFNFTYTFTEQNVAVIYKGQKIGNNNKDFNLV